MIFSTCPLVVCVFGIGGSVQAAVQAGGEEEEGAGPPVGLHCGPDREIL